MVNLATMLIAEPNGLWDKLFSIFGKNLGNFAVGIILLTLIIKLLMYPLEVWNKRSTGKLTNFQIIHGEEIEKIKKRYPNQSVQNQKIGELYRKYNFNPSGACLPSLIFLVLSFVLYPSIFGTSTNFSKYKTENQYIQVRQEYIITANNLTVEEFKENTKDLNDKDLEIYLND